MMTIRELRNIRKEHGILQYEFADLMGVPATTWSNTEAGRLKFHDWQKCKAERVLIELGIWNSTDVEDTISSREPKEKPKLYVDIFEEVAEDIVRTLKHKNSDYGNSFHKTYESHGDLSSLIRISDKVERLKTLIKGDELVTNEPIEDVYRDIAGYAILSLASKQKIKGEST